MLCSSSKQRTAHRHDLLVVLCRLQRFQDINGQLGSFDKDTLKQVDDACKEIARNCELLSIIKADLHSIFKRIRCFQPAHALSGTVAQLVHGRKAHLSKRQHTDAGR